eukprot:jgi/Mesvir1/1058/Mv25690-RA.1
MAKTKTPASRPGPARELNEPSILTNAMRKRLLLSRRQMTTPSMTTTPAQHPPTTPDHLVHPKERDSMDPAHANLHILEDDVVPDLNCETRHRRRGRHAILDDASEDDDENNVDKEDEPEAEQEADEQVAEEEEGDEVDEEDPPPRWAKRCKFIDDEAGVSGDDEDSDGETGPFKIRISRATVASRLS